MSLMIPSTRRVRTWRTDKPPSATLWPRHLRCTQFFFHILDLLARCSCSKACFNNKCMPYEMMSVLVRVAREVLRDSAWGVLLRLYLQHPGMPKKCSFVKLQKNIAVFSKNAVLQQKNVVWTLWFWMGFAPVVWAYFRPGLARSSPGRAPMNCATSSSHGGKDRPALSLVWNIQKLRRRAPGCASSAKAFCSLTRPVNFNFFLGELPILFDDSHNYCSVCGYADLPCPTHLPCMTGRRPSVAAAPPKVHCQTPVMLLEPTVRRSTLGSTLSRSAVVFFESNNKSEHIFCSACITPLPCFATKPASSWPLQFSFAFIVLLRIHRTARTALRRRAGCRSCMLPASCAPCGAPPVLRIYRRKPWDLPWIAIYYWRSRGDLGIVVGLKNEKVEDLQKKRGIDLPHLGNRTCLLHPIKIHAHGITTIKEASLSHFEHWMMWL